MPPLLLTTQSTVNVMCLVGAIAIEWSSRCAEVPGPEASCEHKGAQTCAANKHQRKRDIGRRILSNSCMQWTENEVVSENEGDVFNSNRAGYPPNVGGERIAKPRQGEQRQTVNTTDPNPKEYHRTDWSSCNAIEPKNEGKVNELRRGEGKS